MKHFGNRVEGLKIAYIGGGSRGWAWGLMSDLASCSDISGSVYLYDIDFNAAKDNEVIGNRYKKAPGVQSRWHYKAVKSMSAALTGADFVIISILPGTFDEMESDVHHPEKYGIYQPVGDTTGPGGIIRSLRTIPMFEEFARNIEKYCPKAWVINYTNPMTLCIRTLYRIFPGIKAFGCCHEVFGTQKVLAGVVKDKLGLEQEVDRSEIKVNVLAINHFTWLTSAKYRNVDIYPLYADMCEACKDTGYIGHQAPNWMEKSMTSQGFNQERVKIDLFRRYGIIAAAGDRHLAEFCEGSWYLDSPQQVLDWDFRLTPVSWRKADLQKRLKRSKALLSGETPVRVNQTGEEGSHQIRAILGLCDLVTNVNMPNRGQIPNLPLDAVVETNAVFRHNEVTPVMAGNIPTSIYPLVTRIVGEQEIVNEAAAKRDLNLAFRAFCNDQLVRLPLDQARKLFDEMIENTKSYLSEYFA
ncbi:MAG TPA: alpha-glucosidase/alpha-galactosidase [Clostridiales bacterium]|jgi:alpha-galactosidase|nr:alpha-glucosidase/alpha-galactosidase [Clostridiales bacterium]